VSFTEEDILEDAVVHADHDDAAVGVGHGYERNRQVAWRDPG